MNPSLFEDHLNYILEWWAPFVDWENGGIVTYVHPLKKVESTPRRAPLMHLRQLYNYSVGFEHGHAQSEHIAHHLYNSLYSSFPKRSGSLLVGNKSQKIEDNSISSYLNAYHVIALSRYALAFNHRAAAESALQIYKELDLLFTDYDLKTLGTWDTFDPTTQQRSDKSDNAHIHRCEAALNLFRALKKVAPDQLEIEKNYLQSQIKDLLYFFDTRISRPEDGLTVEHLADDCSPCAEFDYIYQSLAHGFEWLGFCFEIEAHCEITIPFMDDRMRRLSSRTLENGLAPNGCFRNDFYPGSKSAPLCATFWPQVESILGVLWARKRWGEQAFPLEKAQRMMNFYQQYFFKSEALGGGILTTVSENGCPISLNTGHNFKCDHHAVRMVEKVIDYNLLSGIPQ
ncbi:AGE family epimerase/isomerase [Kiritimatiellota bacterium B12222]|nr:AGE family epimerase/isomerase [Kiritimatiellota bacterium B12222]